MDFQILYYSNFETNQLKIKPIQSHLQKKKDSEETNDPKKFPQINPWFQEKIFTSIPRQKISSISKKKRLSHLFPEAFQCRSLQVAKSSLHLPPLL